MSSFFSSFCGPGRLRSHVFPVRAAVVAVVLCLAFGGLPSFVSASTGSNELHRPLEVAGATGTKVVLKWQAKSDSTAGQWRVYSSNDGRTFTLADTIEVTEGIQDYRFSDLRLRAMQPSQVYQLRYLGADGKETVVAVARCTDSGFEDIPAAPLNHHSQTADLVHQALDRPMHDEGIHSAHEGESRRWRPEPEFPPPRTV